jgi:hypothetical protein
MKPRRNQANPLPAGTVGFVSATQISASGGQPRESFEVSIDGESCILHKPSTKSTEASISETAKELMI